jgi:hypothetical protein
MYLFQRFVRAFVNDNLNYPEQFRDVNVLATPANVGGGFPATLYGYNIVNINANTVFVKLYNSASSPTVGTATPVLTIQVPASGSVVLFSADQYAYFNLGLWVACVTSALDGSTLAPGSGVLVQIQYK